MRFYLPEWDDLVDPEYNFRLDEYSKGHSDDAQKHDFYIWQVFSEKTPIDGVLVSRTKIEQDKQKTDSILSNGICSYLRLPKRVSTMCDCGAFGYINEKRPPFRTKDMLEFYRRGSFSLGVSIDHLIVESIRIPSIGKSERNGSGLVEVELENGGETRLLSAKEKQERWQLTLDNALDMIEIWTSEEKYASNFRIVGAIQGWDVSSYRKAARAVLKAGYNCVGIGGLARSQTGDPHSHGEAKTVYNVVRAVCYEARKWSEENRGRVDVHVFGFGRPKAIPNLVRFGVTSFDSATFLRSAWIGTRNYMLDHKEYTAIRVPDARRSPRAKKLNGEFDDWAIMDSLRNYDLGQMKLHTLLEELAALSKAYGEPEERFEQYERTLKDRPWRICQCSVCKSIGVEVVVFRGNERNRRRGFHNNYVFYNSRFRSKLPKVAAIGMCSGKKLESRRLLPAYLRYSASPLFRTYWNKVCDLPIDVKVLSAKFGLVDWSTMLPNYDKRMGPEDVRAFADQLTSELEGYDKVFFIGLSHYRAVAELARKSGLKVEIFPSSSLTDRPLDMFAYTKQMGTMRERILDYVGKFAPSEELVPNLDSFA